MAYPNTAFTNDNTSPEVFKLQLRVYLGAAVYQASTRARYFRGIPSLTHCALRQCSRRTS